MFLIPKLATCPNASIYAQPQVFFSFMMAMAEKPVEEDLHKLWILQFILGKSPSCVLNDIGAIENIGLAELRHIANVSGPKDRVLTGCKMPHLRIKDSRPLFQNLIDLLESDLFEQVYDFSGHIFICHQSREL